MLFIPVFIWSTGLIGETQSFWEVSGLIATERIVIEEVNLKGGVQSCKIYVRNIGKTAIIIGDVIITSPDASLHIYNRPDFLTDLNSVVQGDLMTITIQNLGFSPEQGKTYTLKVFTTRGVGDTYQIVA